MPANEAHFRELLRKYSENTATAEERTELFQLIRERGNEQVFEELMLNELEGTVPQGDYDQLYWDGVFNELIEKAQQPEEQKVRPLILRRLAIAVCALFVISVGGYFLLNNQVAQQTAQNQKQDIAPGQKQVTLTLANGKKLNVNNKQKGKLAQQGNMMVQVNNGNALTYTALAVNKNVSEVAYNTLSTARGQESPFPLVLADGTQVWLNAASSITYPTSFNGKDRVVKITGEVYIKVAHNAAQPFKVLVRGQVIDDIGTVFNINAYDDEPVIKTTLIDGSVKISNNTGSAILKPGQQAIVQPDNQNIKVKDADVEEAVAWKSDYFIFNHEKIQSIMRKISRWYDVDVVYDDGISTDWVGGSESRSKNVSEVLRKLELTGQFHFQIDGKKIIVKK